jgi:ring-1,2-phenylacetyl-CoA epoxidase subunit PaaE
MLKYHSLPVSGFRPDGEHAVYVDFALPPALSAEYRHRPGQHVGIRAVIDGEEVRRNYSLANAPGSDHLRIGIRRQPQGRLSQFLATRVKVGDSLEVLPPNGSFQTSPSAERSRYYVAFAAGSGIAGILSILSSVLETEPRSRCVLFYGNRDTGRIMFLEELLALKDLFLGRFALHFVHSRESQEIELLNGRLSADKVRQFAGRLFDPGLIDEAFLCGPGDMIEAIHGVLVGSGVPASRIHSEHYTVESAPRPLRPGPERESAREAEVTVLIDGRRRTFRMPMQGENIVDAAAHAGIDLPFACKGGVCSTCRTRVVQGAVEMAQNYALEPEEVASGWVLACQSQPTTAMLELDYDTR